MKKLCVLLGATLVFAFWAGCGSTGAPDDGSGGLDSLPSGDPTPSLDGGSSGGGSSGGSVRPAADGGTTVSADGGASGGGTSGGTTTVGRSCAEIFQCMNGCPAGDQSCQQQCYDDGSTQARSQFDGVQQCVQSYCNGQTGTALQACAQQNCSSQLAVCQGTSSGGGGTSGGGTTTPGRTCVEVFQCFNNCPTSDQSCVQQCYDSGSSEAQAQVDAIDQCLQTNCSGQSGSALQTCAEQRCANELSACQNGGSSGGGGTSGGGTGSGTCADVMMCSMSCAAGDTACANACASQASAEAMSQLQALNQCMATLCAMFGTEMMELCAMLLCSAEYEACLGGTTGGGGGGTTGTATCGEIIQCFGGCSDQACYDSCYYGGSAEAQQQIDALDTCLSDHCASVPDSEFNACANQYCAAEMNACEGL